jgi:hypothetical protein
MLSLRTKGIGKLAVAKALQEIQRIRKCMMMAVFAELKFRKSISKLIYYNNVLLVRL